jgi:hypothetical protein
MKASLERVAQFLYRNHRGAYFALVKVGGKQIKRSLRTKDRQMANRVGRVASPGNQLRYDKS